MKKKMTTAVCLAVAFLFSLMTLNAFADETTDAPTETPADGPIASITCLTDLGRAFANDGTLSGAANTRKELYDFSHELAADGKSDALIVSGNFADDRFVSKEIWSYALKQTSEALAEASDTVLYAIGSTDYYAGEEDGYNSANYFDTVMKNRFGTLYYWDFCRETIGKTRYVTAYRFSVNGISFFFLNPAPTDMAGALRFGNFVYTETAMAWVETQMKNVDPNGDALMFLTAHFPLEGDGKRDGTLSAASSERLTEICAGHANLIYLYANTPPATELTDTVVEYSDEGLVFSEKEQTGIGLSSVWTMESGGAGRYSVKNAQTGTYLTVSEGRLALSEEPASWNAELSDGRIYLYSADRTNGVRVTKSGSPAFTYGTATPLELYTRSTDRDGTVYTYSSGLVSGEDCVLVSDSRHVLTADGNGIRTGETRVMGNELVEVEPKTTTEGTPGFTALSSGAVDPEDGSMQFLTLTVYADRVDFQLNRYADGKITQLSSFTRASRPTPEKKPWVNPESVDPADTFPMKKYLLALAAAGFVGLAGSVVVTVGAGKKRFFE